MQPSTYAIDYGTPGRVTNDTINTVIAVLENYELALCGYDEQKQCACPDEGELADADAIASVVQLLKRMLENRHRETVARHVWAQAEKMGWKRSDPTHRDIINAKIAESIAGGAQ